MWQRLWQRWTIDKPAAFGDLLWHVCVVQFAAFLDRLTARQMVAFIPVLILAVAYAHSIPIPPELVLVGAVLAYFDIFSAMFLLGLLSRVTTIVFIVKQAATCAARSAIIVRASLQRLDPRHRHASGAKRAIGWAKQDDDERGAIHGVAWA